MCYLIKDNLLNFDVATFLIPYDVIFVPTNDCCNPTLRECEDEIHTPEMGTWESSKTPETLKFNCKGQNTSH